jgi:hypothetical protein
MEKMQNAPWRIEREADSFRRIHTLYFSNGMPRFAITYQTQGAEEPQVICDLENKTTLYENRPRPPDNSVKFYGSDTFCDSWRRYEKIEFETSSLECFEQPSKSECKEHR